MTGINFFFLMYHIQNMNILEAMYPVLANIINEYISPMPRARQIFNLEWDGRLAVGCYAAFFKQPTTTWNFKRLIQKTRAYRDQIPLNNNAVYQADRKENCNEAIGIIIDYIDTDVSWKRNKYKFYIRQSIAFCCPKQKKKVNVLIYHADQFLTMANDFDKRDKELSPT
jgi:hypothetical protein